MAMAKNPAMTGHAHSATAENRRAASPIPRASAALSIPLWPARIEDRTKLNNAMPANPQLR